MGEAPVLPTIKEELTRKSFETLDWLFTAEKAGQLTKIQASTGVDALFMAVSGLVEHEVNDFIGAAKGISEERFVTKRHLVMGDEIISLIWEVGNDYFVVIKREHGEAISSAKKVFDTPAQAREGVSKAAALLTAKGFCEL